MGTRAILNAIEVELPVSVTYDELIEEAGFEPGSEPTVVYQIKRGDWHRDGSLLPGESLSLLDADRVIIDVDHTGRA